MDTVYLQVLDTLELGTGNVHRFDKLPVRIGREAGQDLVLDESTISRRHCVIEGDGSRVFVRDESSSSGTFLNGHQVRERVELSHGDVVQVGRKLMLRVGIGSQYVAKRQDENNRLIHLSKVVLATVVGVLLLCAMMMGWVVINKQRNYDMLTSTLSVAMGPKDPANRKKTVSPEKGALVERRLEFRDPAALTFVGQGLRSGWNRTVLNRPSRVSSKNAKPIKAWVGLSRDAVDIPKLFSGLDLELAGGEQVIASSYYHYLIPYEIGPAHSNLIKVFAEYGGTLICHVDVWGDLGERYSSPATWGILRDSEFPGRVSGRGSDPIDPRSIDHFDHEAYGRVEAADFSFLDTFLAPDSSVRSIPFDGRSFTFFTDGCRVKVSVYGARNLINRFEKDAEGNSLHAIARAWFDGLTFESDPLPEYDSTELAGELANHRKLLDDWRRESRAADWWPVGGYEKLREIRTTLLKAQRFKEPLEGEPEVRSLYFRMSRLVQDKLKKEYDIAAGGGEIKKKRGPALEKILALLGSGGTELQSDKDNPLYDEWAWCADDLKAELIKQGYRFVQ